MVVNLNLVCYVFLGSIYIDVTVLYGLQQYQLLCLFLLIHCLVKTHSTDIYFYVYVYEIGLRKSRVTFSEASKQDTVFTVKNWFQNLTENKCYRHTAAYRHSKSNSVKIKLDKKSK